jgi:hypothetical protein
MQPDASILASLPQGSSNTLQSECVRVQSYIDDKMTDTILNKAHHGVSSFPIPAEGTSRAHMSANSYSVGSN